MKMSLAIQRADLSYRNVTMEFADQQHYDNYCKVVRINGGKIIHEQIIEDEFTIDEKRKHIRKHIEHTHNDVDKADLLTFSDDEINEIHDDLFGDNN